MLRCWGETLQDLNLIDPLTGLGNRRYFDLRLAQELSRARRYDQPMSLLLVTVYRDAWGHPQSTVEPEVLQRITAFFQHSLRRSDVLTRYGEGDFAIVLPHATAELAELVGGRLVLAAAADASQCEDSIAVRAGISCFPTLAFDEEQLVTQAGAALDTVREEDATQHVLIWQHPTDHLVEVQRLGIPYLAAPIELLNAEIARLVPLNIASRYQCVPVGHERGKVTVAMLDPTNEDLLKRLTAATHLKVHPVVSTRPEITVAVSRMAELWGKQAVLEIVTRQTGQSDAELQLTAKPLTPRADLGRIRRALTEACRHAGGQIRRGDSYAIVVNATQEQVAALLRGLREIGGLLIEDIPGEVLVV